jgi:hypothetical protein
VLRRFDWKDGPLVMTANIARGLAVIQLGSVLLELLAISRFALAFPHYEALPPLAGSRRCGDALALCDIARTSPAFLLSVREALAGCAGQ